MAMQVSGGGSSNYARLGFDKGRRRRRCTGGLPLCAVSLAVALMAAGRLRKDWDRGMGGLGLKCSEDGCGMINFG